MSIRRHIEDAQFLWKNGRRESAFLLAVVAAAGTARKEFPEQGDRTAFEMFVAQIRPYRLSVHYRDKLRPIEEILYKWLRCVLVHEAEWPIDIEIVLDPSPGLSTIRSASGNDERLQISESWFHDLLYVVMQSPTNR